MVRDELNRLASFLAVAEQRSFTRAARRLGVSPSALSHSIRGLEERIGVRLLARTTRSVAPTDAGEQLLARLRPALGDITDALDAVAGLRDHPAGRVRLLVSRVAATSVLAPKLGAFVKAFPDVVLDVVTDDSRLDLVAGGFDAGIQLGEYIQADMVAVRVSPDRRGAIVGSPEYFAAHPRPKTPRDLTRHRCLGFRLGAAGVYDWEFEKGRQALTVAARNSLIVDDMTLLVRAALDGAGLAFISEQYAAPYLERGALLRVLEDWCPPYAGFFLYYPSRRHQPAALAALIQALRV